MVAGHGNLVAKEGRSFVRDRPHEDDTISVETNRLQRAGQVELIVNTGGSHGAPVPIAKCSEQTLALAVVLPRTHLIWVRTVQQELSY